MAARYLLDTNICIYIAKHNPAQVRQRFLQHSADELAISVITWGELLFGVEKSQHRERSLAVLRQLAHSVQVLPMQAAVGEHYGQIRAALQRAGQPIGNNDLWLSAHARAESLIMVTHNTREFARVEGLSIENWAE